MCIKSQSTYEVPSYDSLFSCIEYYNEHTGKGSIDHKKFLEHFRGLSRDDIFLYKGQSQPEGLDKAIYEQSSQAESDHTFLMQHKGDTFGLLFNLPTDVEYNENGLSFPNYAHHFNLPEKVTSYYINFDDIYFPVIPSCRDKGMQLFFECQGLMKRPNLYSFRDASLLLLFKPYSYILKNTENNLLKDAYIVDPIGLYIVNQKTREVLLNLNSYIRNLDVSEKERLNKALTDERKRVVQKNTPKYHQQAKRVICFACMGQGYIIIHKIRGMAEYDDKIRCGSCYGKGYTMEHYY